MPDEKNVSLQTGVASFAAFPQHVILFFSIGTMVHTRNHGANHAAFHIFFTFTIIPPKQGLFLQLNF
ncbi:MAG: hypothetical protein ABIO46_12965 [Chitinophagales bacterium]